ncbi:hypothetical protein NSPZN2_10506 [Nitrospira defluvii]|uniref:Transposase n=1 Tax=Nitrospira defluvii TaxID=330214 RepID=A0ABN7KJL9_9BACT|nr:hypothetical protein NSPZN2_10506 [Nitrospira defluvii]
MILCRWSGLRLYSGGRWSSLVVMMVALGAMDVGGLRRRGQLSGKHNPARFVLFGQMFGNLGVESFDVADHPIQKPA